MKSDFPPCRSEQLLTQLDSNTRILRANYAIPKRHLHLIGHRLNNPRQEMVLPLPMFLPRREVPQLAIVSVIGEPHLRADEEDLFVMNDNTAVIDHVLVHYGPGSA